VENGEGIEHPLPSPDHLNLCYASNSGRGQSAAEAEMITAESATAFGGCNLELIETEDHISSSNDNFLHDHQYSALLPNSLQKGPYKCSLCGKIFFMLRSLKRHFVRFHKGKIKRAPPKDEHLNSEHSEIDSAVDDTSVQKANVKKPSADVLTVCQLCGWISNKSMSLEVHMQSHSGEQQNSETCVCDICRMSFDVRWKLLRHVAEDHKQIPPGVACDTQSKLTYAVAPRAMCDICGWICKASSKTSRDFLQHMRKHTGEKPFKCGQCTLAFAARANLRRHEVLHSGRGQFLCQYCAQSFQQKSSLFCHMYRNHADKLDPDHSKRPFRCRFCCERFHTDYHVRQHVSRHHQSAFCERCGHMCSCGYAELKVHMLKHSTSGQSYQCSKCEKSFGMESTLKLHMRLHSKDAFTCTVCSKKFMFRSMLSYHMDTHIRPRHAAAECDSISPQTFTCEVCGKIFGSMIKLKNHESVHTGAKPYLCTSCGRAFRRRQHLSRHMRTHTKFKPYCCSLCGKTYSERVDLRRHCTRVHNVQLPPVRREGSTSLSARPRPELSE